MSETTANTEKPSWLKLPKHLEGQEDRIVFFDIETDASVDLTEVGGGRYFSDPATRVTLTCWKRLGEPEVKADVDPEYKAFLSELRDNDILVAHNAIFDLMGTRISPAFPGRLICTRAMCSSINIPASLKESCRVMNTDHQKADMPDALKASIEEDYAGEALFDANDDQWREFVDYGKKDVLALEELFCRVSHRVSEDELKAIDAHLRINLRGIPFSREGLKEEGDRLRREQLEQVAEFKKLVGFAPTQTALLLTWIADRNGFKQAHAGNRDSLGIGKLDDEKRTKKVLTSVSKKDLEAIYDQVDDLTKKVLDLRKKASKHTAAKLVRIRSLLDKGDEPIGRLRDSFRFAGAITGRWKSSGADDEDHSSGGRRKSAGANMQNNERGGIIKDLVVAPEGMSLYVGDFSQIELRVALWLTKEDEALRLLHTKSDFYIETASVVYNKPTDKITPSERFFGKSLVLGANYGMGAERFQAFCAQNGSEVSLEEAQSLVGKYRTSRAGLSNSWRNLETALKNALRSPGQKTVPLGVRGVWFYYDKKRRELIIKLPTQRLMRYGGAEFVKHYERYTVKYHDPGEFRDKYFSHGGLILENICQAVSRDLLCRALVRFEEHFDGEVEGVVAHVHDEVIAQVKKGTKKEVLDDLMIAPEFKEVGGKNGLMLDLESKLVQKWGDAK